MFSHSIGMDWNCIPLREEENEMINEYCVCVCVCARERERGAVNFRSQFQHNLTSLNPNLREFSPYLFPP